VDGAVGASGLAFSPDEQRLAVAFFGYGGTPRPHVRVVDVVSGRVVRDLAVGADDETPGGRANPLELAFGPDPDTLFVLFEDGKIERYRGDAREAVLDTGAAGFGGRLVPSASGRRLAVPLRDGSVRIHDGATGALLATLADFDDEEWALYTPGGAYAGTAEVGERIAWVFDAPAEAFPFEQFAQYRDPRLVARRLAGEDADAPGLAERPPSAEILAVERAGDKATLHVRVSAGGRVDAVRAFVGGTPADARAVCAAQGDVALTVPLSAGSNQVAVLAYDAHGAASNASTRTIVGPTGQASSRDAWAVAVGVDRYPALPPGAQLAAAESDARGVVDALRSQVGSDGDYRALHDRLLLGDGATPSSIEAALRGLSAMQPQDVAVVFLAGHGLKPGASEDMLFVTAGATLDPSGRALTAESESRDTLSWNAIAGALSGARGRVLVLLDACHAGHVTQELLVPDDAMAERLWAAGRAGIVVFAASKGRQVSFEPGGSRGLVLDADARGRVQADSHGFFTGALLATLADPASDHDRDGEVEVSELVDEVTRRVSEATRGLQTPWVARRELVGDFAVARRAR
jgi:hypothetical protein